MPAAASPCHVPQTDLGKCLPRSLRALSGRSRPPAPPPASPSTARRPGPSGGPPRRGRWCCGTAGLRSAVVQAKEDRPGRVQGVEAAEVMGPPGEDRRQVVHWRSSGRPPCPLPTLLLLVLAAIGLAHPPGDPSSGHHSLQYSTDAGQYRNSVLETAQRWRMQQKAAGEPTTAGTAGLTNSSTAQPPCTPADTMMRSGWKRRAAGATI